MKYGIDLKMNLKYQKVTKYNNNKECLNGLPES